MAKRLKADVRIMKPLRPGALTAAALAVAGCGLLIPFTALAGGEGGSSHQVILNIALCMVSASVLGLLMKVARQPLILGHILAGVIIGPIGIGLIDDHTEIVTIAEIGLILLLFMIGLEIDLRKMLAAGKLVIVPGLLQFPICLGLGYLTFYALEFAGFSLGGFFPRLYVALAISISSTMIVVKLLYEKFELDTLAGRITLGVLVFQDVWAIIILAIQPNLADPNLIGIARTFFSGGLLVAAALLTSKYILPRVFQSVAKLPELLMVLSLGWCFLVSLVASHHVVGLSMEMGALIAGVALATFPYNLDVICKVVSIRDFFITLFFVALGMQIPVPNGAVLVAAPIIVAVALAIRVFGIFGVLHLMKSGHRIALLTTLNLGQISEFSLVILSLGIGYGHITGQTLTYIIWVFVLLAIASTYFIVYSHPLQSALGRALSAVGINDIGFREEELEDAAEHPIVVLGFFRAASALLDEIARKHPQLLSQIKVVDFNPVVKQKLAAMGVACEYGDISHLDTLRHADIHDAKIILSTISDPILKGTSNRKLLGLMRHLCPHAKIILTAELPSHAESLYQAGADYVIQSSAAAGSAALNAVTVALRGELDALKNDDQRELAEKQEVLH